MSRSTEPVLKVACPLPECKVELLDFLSEGQWSLYQRLRNHINYQHKGHYEKMRQAHWLRSRMRARIRQEGKLV